jgi:hypothetical protein
MKKYLKIFMVILYLAGIQTATAQTKRALLVAIENYPEQNGWNPINSLRDVVMLKDVLLRQDFKEANINVLTDAHATKLNIIKAIDRLIETVKKGDIVLIHFSSHGVQIEDDDDDEEIDGKDESIVPFDAVYSADTSQFNKLADSYFRDDLFGEKMTLLRNRLGKSGDVLVSIDACHSGTGTRGKPTTRGGKPALVSGNFNKRNKAGTDTAGVFKEKIVTLLNDDAASYVVISGAQADELNDECYDDEERPVGSLSYALSKTLSTLDEKKTYRTLFAQVENILLEKAPKQKPVLEGDGIDRELFGGRYQLQKPYVVARADAANKLKINLSGGTVVGIRPGSVIGLYPAGTTTPSDNLLIDKGTVQSASNFSSVIMLKKANPKTNGKILWAFVTEANYSLKKIKLSVDSVNARDIETLKLGLRDFQLVEFKPPYDLYVTKSESGSGWSIRYPGTGSLFADNVSDINSVKEILKRFDRFRFLRNLTATQTGVSAKVELVFRTNDGKIDSAKIKSRTKFGRLEIKEGDKVYPVITNTGKLPFYINIVDIQPDGIINPVIPNRNLKPAPISFKECLVNSKQSLPIKFSITMGPPYGEETYKIFLSTQPLDLEEILTSNGENVSNSRGPGGALNSLAKVFKDAQPSANGTRGDTKINTSKDGTIFNLNFKIVPQ